MFEPVRLLILAGLLLFLTGARLFVFALRESRERPEDSRIDWEI
jgi:hypothetical protein